MKISKLLSSAAAVITALTSLAGFPVRAEDALSVESELTDGAFVYEVVDGSYTIVKCTATVVTSVPAVRNGVSITAIGDGAFSGCTGISEIDLPDSIKSIGDNAFVGCSSLQKITFPARLEHLGEFAFMGCSMLTTVELPDTLTEIPKYAFSMCDHMTEIQLPDSITTIGEGAFYECTSLEKFRIPAKLKEIKPNAFQEWYSIQEIDASANDSFTVEDGMLMDAKKSVIYRGLASIEGDLYIPNGVTTVRTSAFSGCGRITNLFLPESLTLIESYAFSFCPNIKNVDFSEGLTAIGESAFAYDQSITSISVPTTVTEIGSLAFAYNLSAEQAILPEGIETIGAKAFIGCDKLLNVSVPKSVTSIGEMAFGKTYGDTDSTIDVDGFSMSVYSGSEAQKYAKSSKVKYTVVDRSLKNMAFIVIAVGLLLTAVVFAFVLMARGKKSADRGAKKAKKKEAAA